MRIRFRGIVDFFGTKMHEIISQKPRRVERVDKTLRINPASIKPKETDPKKKRSSSPDIGNHLDKKA